jgi:hypothetical protein
MDSNVGNEMIPPFIPPETAWLNDAPFFGFFFEKFEAEGAIIRSR